ncbi:hypothetical protein N7540_002081 [Penicillium herquei]|nr:hypothetical protein N7540_002081 [Penicillium herquei]
MPRQPTDQKVKTGCLICRRRRKKCDENKPSCIGCVRNGLDCQWPLESGGRTRRPQRITDQVECQQPQTETQTVFSVQSHDEQSTISYPASPCERPLGGSGAPSSLLSALPGTCEIIALHDSDSLPHGHDTMPATVFVSSVVNESLARNSTSRTLREPIVPRTDRGVYNPIAPQYFQQTECSQTLQSDISPDLPITAPTGSMVVTQEVVPLSDSPRSSQHSDADDIQNTIDTQVGRDPNRETACPGSYCDLRSDEIVESHCNMSSALIPVHNETPRPPQSDELSQSQNSVYSPLKLHPSKFPDQHVDSFRIINYYLQNTAVDMANGATPDNPFLYQMIPLAFSSELMLSLIVAQGVVHGKEKGNMAFLSSHDSQYVKSLHSLQRYIGEYIVAHRKTEHLIELTAGTLSMCLIEATRGDTNGTCLDHILAAQFLIHDLLSRGISIPPSLRSFLLEWYIYVAASSSLRSSSRHTYKKLISKTVAEAGLELVKSGYIGNLSGCWLGLLLLIPRVVDFRREYIEYIASEGEPSIQLMVMFAELHAEIAQWTPKSAATPDVALVGNIHQQAVLVFLLSAVANGKNIFLSGPLDMTLAKHVSQGLEFLAKLPFSARLNTNLCWPITVLGSCLDDPQQQDLIRNRLISSQSLLGFRNISWTAAILEHLWGLSEDEKGPWKIPYVMDENQLWITFA